MPEQMTPQQMIEYAQAQQKIAEDKFQRDIAEISKSGKEQYGVTYEQCEQAIVNKLGDNVRALSVPLADRHHAPEIIVHLGENETELDRLMRLPPNRRNDELVRLDDRFGRGNHSAEPAYKAVARGGMSVEEFRRTGGEGLSDDQWNRLFERSEKDKVRKVPR